MDKALAIKFHFAKEELYWKPSARSFESVVVVGSAIPPFATYAVPQVKVLAVALSRKRNIIVSPSVGVVLDGLLIVVFALIAVK